MGCKGVLNLIEWSESLHRKTQELNRDWVVVAISRLYLPPNEEELWIEMKDSGKAQISSSLETFTSFLLFFKLKINSWKKYDHQSKFKSDLSDHPASLIQYKNCTEKQ